jgi:hypothetical protein
MSGWNNQGNGGGGQQPPHGFTEQEQYAYQCQQFRDAFENGGLNPTDPQNVIYYNMAYPGQQNPYLSYQVPVAPYGTGYRYNAGGIGMQPGTGYNPGGYRYPHNTPWAFRRHLRIPTTCAALVTMDYHRVEGTFQGTMTSPLISLRLSIFHLDNSSSLNTRNLKLSIPEHLLYQATRIQRTGLTTTTRDTSLLHNNIVDRKDIQATHLSIHLMFDVTPLPSLTPALVARRQSYMPALPIFSPLLELNFGVIRTLAIHMTPSSLHQHSRWKKGRRRHGERSKTRKPTSINPKTFHTSIILCG